MTNVILADPHGSPIGSVEIVAAHSGEGQLHKAFSIYIFRKDRSEILIQKRSKKKMLWPEIWANACCSHPRVGEEAIEAGARRLHEELGFTCTLEGGGSFVYRAEDPQGRGVEHEYVTILLGEADDPSVRANPEEVMEWKWITLEALHKDMNVHPDSYAPWFHLGLAQILTSARTSS